jgi:Methyltransferase domain
MATDDVGLRKRVAFRVFKVIKPYVHQETLKRALNDEADARVFAEVYGRFTRPAHISTQPIEVPTKQSRIIPAELVQFVEQAVLTRPIRRLLLPGEKNGSIPAYGEWLQLNPDQITTAGLGKSDKSDFRWNFEHDAPADLGTFSLIISQSMLEHLIDPYKHVRDLFSLLEDGGDLIMHTEASPFPYHRVPIDCLRFYPDWFETVAERIGAEVKERFVGKWRIMYHFTRPQR